jgi:arginine-tRNA-protein transferase
VPFFFLAGAGVILYSRPEFTPPAPCPYLPGRVLVYESFFADGLNGRELTWFLTRGWRKFGHSFFRPACPGCRACVPLRVPVERFRPSRSQRRILRRCAGLRVEFGPLRYRAEFFDLYQRHSLARFAQECSFEDFAASLHSPSCPTLVSTYAEGGRILGAGYLDVAADGLSSVYFVFDPERTDLSLGVYSVLREIEEARRMGLAHYYLGYVVPGCDRMAYKAAFRPHQLFDWEEGQWLEEGREPEFPAPGMIHPFSGWTGRD